MSLITRLSSLVNDSCNLIEISFHEHFAIEIKQPFTEIVLGCMAHAVCPASAFFSDQLTLNTILCDQSLHGEYSDDPFVISVNELGNK